MFSNLKFLLYDSNHISYISVDKMAKITQKQKNSKPAEMVQKHVF